MIDPKTGTSHMTIIQNATGRLGRHRNTRMVASIARLRKMSVWMRNFPGLTPKS